MLFKGLNWFNSDAMKLVYFAISTIISFALSYVVMILEQYAVYIAIGLGLIILILASIITILYVKSKKKDDKGVNNDVL